ncbi:MAG: IPT/TIG domain-containing protein, partial [Candidatus Acidiferrales bacterium]
MRRAPGLAVILCLAVVVAKSGCAVADPAASAVPKTPPSIAAPAITSIAPSTVTEGGSAFTLAVTGSNFALDSVILWNGAPRQTTFSNAGQVTATISASDISSVAPVSIGVRNPTSGRQSNTMPLTIEPAAAAPTVSGIAPTTVTEGGPGFALMVAGTNLGLDTVVLWNGAARQTTFQSPSQVAATIAASDIATVVPVAIGVRNQNSGRQSNSMPLTIQAATTVSPPRITTTQLPNAQENVAYRSVLSAAGGTPPYQWSLHSGQLPPGLALAAIGEIAGTPTANGTFSFGVELNDSDPSSSTPAARVALSLIVLAPGNPSPTPGFPTDGTCGPAGCYGPAMGADSLANTVVGPHGNRVSYRFRARHTGDLKSIRVYFIADAVGYSGGTSGKIDVSVHADSGASAHIPTTQLANYVIANPLDLPRPGRTFRHITFTTSPRLVAGDLYHIVFTNVDASPTVNYLSVDALFQRNPQSPTQPAISDVDSALLLDNNNQQWKPRPGYTPIIQFEYADGWTEGIGYMEA